MSKIANMVMVLCILMEGLLVNDVAWAEHLLDCNFLQKNSHTSYGEKCEPDYAKIAGVSVGAAVVVGGLVYLATAEGDDVELEEEFIQTLEATSKWVDNNLVQDERGVSFKVFEW